MNFSVEQHPSVAADRRDQGMSPSRRAAEAIDCLLSRSRRMDKFLRPCPARLSSGSHVGSYRIDRLLDRGGMASVYEATDLRLGRLVALKVLDAEHTHESVFRRRFLRESRFAAALDHPNIVPIFEAGEADGRLYIAMRYVRAGNLQILLADQAPLDARRTLAILQPIANALDAAHSAGLIHRDVKPANVLLDRPNGLADDEYVYLSDFGVTKRASGVSALTLTGGFIGTTGYTAPEQIRGERVDARSDVYSLACVAFECLTGVLPLVRDNQAALLWAHLHDAPDSVSDHRSDLSGVDAIFDRALAKDPLDRFHSCGEFTAALSAALSIADPLVEKRNTSTGERWADTGPALSDAPPPFFSGPAVGRVMHPSTRWVRSAATLLIALLLASAVIHAPASLPVSPALHDIGAIRPAALATVLSSSAGSGGEGIRGAVGADQESRPTALSSDSAKAATVTAEPAQAIPTIDGSPVKIGETAGSVATTPDGRFAYVADSESGSVTVLDLSARRIAAIIGIAVGAPRYVSVTPDGKLAYVSVYTADETTNVIVVIDVRTRAILQTIPVDRAPGVPAISPDGRLVYVPSTGAHVIDVISISAGDVVDRINVPPDPVSIAFTPDGARAFVSAYDSDVVTTVLTSTGAIIDTVSVGAGPRGVAVSPDGKQIAVGCRDSDSIYFIDAMTNEVVGIVPAGNGPSDIAYTPDGALLYAVSPDSDTVSVTDVVTRQITAELPADSPTSIAFLRNGRNAYVTNQDAGTLTVLRTA